MACQFIDNVYTQIFTPKEYQVELLEAAKEKNTIICSSSSATKIFVVVKLLQEMAWEMRSKNGKKALFILDLQNIKVMRSHIELLTDIEVLTIEEENTNGNWGNETFRCPVIITSIEICLNIITQKLGISNLNLIVIDDCLYGEKQIKLSKLMNCYHETRGHKPRIVGLAAGVLDTEIKPECLENELVRLQNLLSCSVNTSSELVTLLRFCCHPQERLVECARGGLLKLQTELEQIMLSAQRFLDDHRFDPSEIYSDDFLDELLQLPDPKKEPLKLMQCFLDILNDLGPWAANQVALTLLALVEKLKVKVAYERHYLLLCLISTVLVHIRALCDLVFQGLSDSKIIQTYSTPKLLRFLEILKEFKPPGEKPIIEEKPAEEAPATVSVRAGRGRNPRGPKRPYVPRPQHEDTLCALVFVHNRFTAKVLYHLLHTMYQNDEAYWWVSPLYSVEKIADPSKDACEAEMEYRRQEEVLRKFRMHDCNVMIATSVLEQGCDLPKCNLVIHFDAPKTFHSYVQCKARARANDAHYVIMINEDHTTNFIHQLSEYMEVEKTLLRYCHSLELNEQEELETEWYSINGPVYKPSNTPSSPCLTLTNAVAFINRYCAKLPSDTFTRLTPIWDVSKTKGGYECNLRLPINSPLKHKIMGTSTINALLACRMAAFKTCKLLHESKELDNNLQPIAKENFFASEDDWNSVLLEPEDEVLAQENLEPRPGTTKRRQYYYKRIADAFINCLPTQETSTYFYKIVMTLTCPLPEEQNTRGRRIYPPEDSPEGFGILTSKRIPKICAFPIFTRSGEVSVDLQLCSDSLIMDEQHILKVTEFVNYSFNIVLRLQRYLMLFNPTSSENCFLIAPTKENKNGVTEVDWNFIDLIYNNRQVLPKLIPDEERSNYKFELEKYKDAVVMPWYRNQDQPQYFYVAEICTTLSPKSSFPGSDYSTFEEYYFRKYGIVIQNKEQHLLDVDHTSARLNFLTPRYVNRKGVALPTSSEETKRAKRENLEQKQILVPELCVIHPFSASLWRKAVCLPCILYRINALLLADQVRSTVAKEIGLGKLQLKNDFQWPALNFGWNLADVLKKSKEQTALKIEIKEEEENCFPNDDIIEELTIREIGSDGEEIPIENDENKDWVEIGMWSNDMADAENCNENMSVRYASPTSWLCGEYEDFSDSDESFSWNDVSNCGGLRIEFTGENTAEAVEEDSVKMDESVLTQTQLRHPAAIDECSEELRSKFLVSCETNKAYLSSSSVFVGKNQKFEKFVERFHDSLNANFYTNYGNGDMYFSISPPSEIVDNIMEVTKVCNVKNNVSSVLGFSFDEQPNLTEHPGPSPSLILQALTMSNANDGINLERLETIGDSFLKYAITNYLYVKYENVHEGKLSHLRSKQVSNLNLYRLGKRKELGECMIATKFDPHDNWLPPCYYVPKELEEALMDACVPANYWTPADVAATRDMTIEEVCQMVRERGEMLNMPSMLPYNLVSQHSIPDKSIADCVEALIGAYLIECGPRGALLFMAWLGIRVLPLNDNGSYSELKCVSSPLLRNVANPEAELEILLDGYDKLEDSIGYHFNDRAYLLQALTHASYSPNTLTDCYQRLEFLGDAVLDYLITRHLYEDKRMHSPGALTDLRSALVNNTIFASLAVRHGFHRYFRHLSPGLHEVVERFVRIQEENGHTLVEELYLLAEHECEEVEDVEVPKALGDVFESVAGAIFLDSGMSLDAVWEVYYRMMCNEIERFSNQVPKSPIRELLELEPETAKFGRPEKLADGRRVRVIVEIFGKGIFKGIGRNYRIAKCTAAKCALKYLKKRGLVQRS